MNEGQIVTIRDKALNGKQGTIKQLVKVGRWEYAMVDVDGMQVRLRPNQLELVRRQTVPPPSSTKQAPSTPRKATMLPPSSGTIRGTKPRSGKKPPQVTVEWGKSKINPEYKKMHEPDALALELRELTLDQLYKRAQKTTDEDLKSRYSHLNVGMQRMNLNNRIRASEKK